MASDTPSIIVQSVRTSRSSFSSSNGYETPSHYSAITNGDDYDSDGSNFAPPTPMTLLNSIPAELVGAIPLIDKFQVEGFLRAMQKQINSAGKRGFFSKRSVGPQDRDKLTFEDMLCFQKEFVAHSANVNCLKIGKKTHRIFITGGDDEKVNLWSIGKPTSITSLSGHTSPIESVAFDSTEVLVAAGASSGVIKLWDLEETKVVRTLNGHRSYCTAVEFHPFGEFFASGSMDTNLKIWDIRKKGCIHTYKGHRRAVSTIRFSPDGRWVVSGGLDNVVKIWDLTAGKLLHDFKFHEGHIKSMDFHPLEFLLATDWAQVQGPNM